MTLNLWCGIAVIVGAFLGLAVVMRAASPEVYASRRIKCAVGLDVRSMLKAIRQVESGENPAAIGPRGERSAYQFMPGTWGIHTDAPFVTATLNPVHADRVAWDHLNFICAQLERRNLPREPLFIAAAWHYGHNFCLSQIRTDHVQRVANLYWDQCN